MSERILESVYTRYGETRPGEKFSPSQQLTIREPVFRKFFLPVLPQDRQAKILDIGCGYGEFLCFLRRIGFAQTLGIDLDSKSLEIARSNGAGNLRQAEILTALADYHGEFDLISALDVLEHVPKPRVVEFLTLALGALRSGGTLLCQVPNLAAFYSPLFYMDFTHETPFTAMSLKQALEMANFNEVKVYPMGPVAHGFKSAIRTGLWRVINSGFRWIQIVESARRDPLASIYTAAIYAVARKAAV